MKQPPKIVRVDSKLETPYLDKKLLELGVNLVLLPDGVSEQELLTELGDADLLLMCYTPVTKTVLEHAKRLKGIVKYGVGIDAIDIVSAREGSIPVVNIPEYAEETVAEGAFALMIALAKKLLPLQREMRSGGWAWPTEKWIGSDISGKTVGLVGLGKIGKSMARMAGAGFGANVIGYSPHTPNEVFAKSGVRKIEDLQEMVSQCDFVSIHCVLNKETYHLIGEKEFAAMKSTAMLVNVSRGAIVDEPALLKALQNGQIAGAGLDVYSQEPLDKQNHPMRALFEMDNVLLTPHLAFYTKEAMKRLEEETLQRCIEILNGEPVVIKSKDPRLTAQTSGVVFQE